MKNNYIMEIIDRIKAVPIEKEIIVIDDASVDGTREILSKITDPQVKVFFS